MADIDFSRATAATDRAVLDEQAAAIAAALEQPL
jgi:hypothetical protein